MGAAFRDPSSSATQSASDPNGNGGGSLHADLDTIRIVSFLLFGIGGAGYGYRSGNARYGGGGSLVRLIVVVLIVMLLLGHL